MHLLVCQRDIQQDPGDALPIHHPNQCKCEEPLKLPLNLSVHQCTWMCMVWQCWQNCYWHHFDVAAVAGSRANDVVPPAAVASWYALLPLLALVLPPGAHVTSVHPPLLHMWAEALEPNATITLCTFC
jgi:hypothetical protein